MQAMDAAINVMINEPDANDDPTIDKPPQGWTTTPLKISVPSKNAPPTDFTVDGFIHRSVTSIIKHVFTSASAQSAGPFHYVPYREYWNPTGKPEEPEQRIYGELYTSEAWNEAHEDIQKQKLPDGHGEGLERVVAALMFWSDATHLATFGQAKLWPIYELFGNQSKYIRCRPTARSSHHLAYLPSVSTLYTISNQIRDADDSFQLPDHIQDHIKKHSGWGKAGRKQVLTYCRRELLHEAWVVLLSDPEFLEAYEHGIVIKCADGVTRLVFPRIFTYSADYPEKSVP